MLKERFLDKGAFVCSLAPAAVISIALLVLSVVATGSAQDNSINPSMLAKARAGDAYAQWYLGFHYMQGKGVPQDYAQAAVWYRRSADQGNANAQSLLGRLYHQGQGVPQDDAQAAIWWRKAAEQGQMFAQGSLGRAYERGRGVPQDYAQAAEWYRKAANQGDPIAQSYLGLLYEEGKGVPQDYAESYFWLDLAVAQETKDVQEADSKSRDDAAKKLTPEELIRVQARATKWFEDHPAKPQ